MNVMLPQDVVQKFSSLVPKGALGDAAYALELLNRLTPQITSNPSILQAGLCPARPLLESWNHLTDLPPGLTKEQTDSLRYWAHELALYLDKQQKNWDFGQFTAASLGKQTPGAASAPQWLACAVRFPKAKAPYTFFVIHEYSSNHQSVKLYFVVPSLA